MYPTRGLNISRSSSAFRNRFDVYELELLTDSNNLIEDFMNELGESDPESEFFRLFLNDSFPFQDIVNQLNVSRDAIIEKLVDKLESIHGLKLKYRCNRKYRYTNKIKNKILRLFATI